MKTIEDFLTQFRRERGWSRTLFGAVPEAQAGWAPSPSDFSCLGLLRHLIQAEVFWRRLLLAGARGEAFDPFGLPGTPLGLPQPPIFGGETEREAEPEARSESRSETSSGAR